MRFTAIIDFTNRDEAIVTLFDNGEWSGSERISAKGRDALYERGYAVACRKAAFKGGDLSRYSRGAA